MKIAKTICKQCGVVTGEISRIILKKEFIINKKKQYCDSCKKQRYDRHKWRMEFDNPAKKSEIKEKISNTLKKKYQTKEISSPFQNPELLRDIRSKRKGLSESGRKSLQNRMIQDNPMFDANVSKKVGDTIKRKYKSGELIYPKGHLHHLYKGTRNFSNECRKWLKSWLKSVKERDNFTCVCCGIRGGYLHTHHIRPLRQIIKEVLTSRSIIDINKLKNDDINRYEELIQIVVNSHKLEDGISLCKQCHANIDNRYRRVKRTKHENQVNSSGTVPRESIQLPLSS